jgi:hypothetical protein
MNDLNGETFPSPRRIVLAATRRRGQAGTRITVQAEQEVFSFQAEVAQILDLMAHSLYSNKEIFPAGTHFERVGRD